MQLCLTGCVVLHICLVVETQCNLDVCVYTEDPECVVTCLTFRSNKVTCEVWSSADLKHVKLFYLNESDHSVSLVFWCFCVMSRPVLALSVMSASNNDDKSPLLQQYDTPLAASVCDTAGRSLSGLRYTAGRLESTCRSSIMPHWRVSVWDTAVTGVI